MAAVCFGGYHAVNVYAQGENLRKQLIEPLLADVFLSLTYRRDDNCSDVASCQILKRLQKLQPISKLQLEPMMPTKDLADTLEKLPHWPDVIRTFNNSHRTCTRKPDWRHEDADPDSTPWTCIHLQNTQYNTIFSPVIGLNTLNVLRQHYALYSCLRLIHSHEASHGLQYNRIVHSRLEFVWLAPHPPLRLMDLRCAWVPDGEDYGGLNDRHAVLNREHAVLYMARWEMILDGRVMQNNANLRTNTCCGSMSDEKWLRNIVHFHHIPVCRFPQLSYLTCCNAQTRKNCFRHHCFKESVFNMTFFAKSAAEFAGCAHSARLLRDPNVSFVSEGTLNLTSGGDFSPHRLSLSLKPGTMRSPRNLYDELYRIPGYILPD
ncbi:MAG: hypothetical protein SGPRY_004329 [Prymnesium sp.]